jgi:hypothetical protein
MLKADGQSISDLLQQGVSVQHAVVPLYMTGSFKASAVVRVDRAFMDYEHRGFFRIGLFPIGVLDGVTFDTQETANPAGSLACVRRWLGTKAGQRIEMRRVKFLLSPTNHLEAGLARSLGKDRWELLNGVRLFSGASEVHAPRAMLEMAGVEGGRLILDTVPRSTFPFLASALTLADSSSPSVADLHSNK